MKQLSDIAVDVPTLTAVKAFVTRIIADFPVAQIILFGSRARGWFRPDSDADLAILLQGAPVSFLPTKLAMADIAYDILLETGIRIQPLPIWEEEWQHPEKYTNPYLLRNIEQEGIVL